jgi:hypothetical protein
MLHAVLQDQRCCRRESRILETIFVFALASFLLAKISTVIVSNTRHVQSAGGGTFPPSSVLQLVKVTIKGVVLVIIAIIAIITIISIAAASTWTPNCWVHAMPLAISARAAVLAGWLQFLASAAGRRKFCNASSSSPTLCCACCSALRWSSLSLISGWSFFWLSCAPFDPHGWLSGWLLPAQQLLGLRLCGLLGHQRQMVDDQQVVVEQWPSFDQSRCTTCHGL